MYISHPEAIVHFRSPWLSREIRLCDVFEGDWLPSENKIGWTEKCFFEIVKLTQFLLIFNIQFVPNWWLRMFSFEENRKYKFPAKKGSTAGTGYKVSSIFIFTSASRVSGTSTTRPSSWRSHFAQIAKIAWEYSILIKTFWLITLYLELFFVYGKKTWVFADFLFDLTYRSRHQNKTARVISDSNTSSMSKTGRSLARTYYSYTRPWFSRL
jgi:hypothetical protein